MRTVSLTLYKIDELEPKAQARAIEDHRDWLVGGYDPWSSEWVASAEAFLEALDIQPNSLVWDINRNFAAIDPRPNMHDSISDLWFGEYQTKVGADLAAFIREKYPKIVEAAESEGCDLTGFCGDEDLLDPIRAFMANPAEVTPDELVQKCLTSWVNAWRADEDYRTSDEGVRDSIEANEVEFTIDGNSARSIGSLLVDLGLK